MANEYRHPTYGLVFAVDYDENEVLIETPNGMQHWVFKDDLDKLKLPHSNPLVLTKEATQENTALLKEILAELKALRKEIRS